MQTATSLHRSVLLAAGLLATTVVGGCRDGLSPAARPTDALAAKRPGGGALICPFSCPSPYDQQILVSRYWIDQLGANLGVYEPHVQRMNPDGTGVVNLGVGDDAVWNKTHTKIAFTGFVSLGNGQFNSDIFVMNPDGTAKVQLTFDSAATDRQPSISPDGTKIAFVSNRDGDDEIYVMNADGSNVVQLTKNSYGRFVGGPADVEPAWSPDGKRIAFSSTRAGGYNIVVMNADGSNQQLLTGDGSGTVIRHPSWRPDGLRLYVSVPNETGCHFWEISPDFQGAGLIQVSNAFESCDAPKYSPDGTKVLFTGYKTGYYPTLYRINRDGTGLTQVGTGYDDDRGTAWR